jgi:hypothetical protein
MLFDSCAIAGGIDPPGRSPRVAPSFSSHLARHPYDPTRAFNLPLSCGPFATWDVLRSHARRLLQAMPVGIPPRPNHACAISDFRPPFRASAKLEYLINGLNNSVNTLL